MPAMFGYEAAVNVATGLPEGESTGFFGDGVRNEIAVPDADATPGKTRATNHVTTHKSPIAGDLGRLDLNDLPSSDEVFGLRMVADDGCGRLLRMELKALAHLDPDTAGIE